MNLDPREGDPPVNVPSGLTGSIQDNEFHHSQHSSEDLHVETQGSSLNAFDERRSRSRTPRRSDQAPSEDYQDPNISSIVNLGPRIDRSSHSRNSSQSSRRSTASPSKSREASLRPSDQTSGRSGPSPLSHEYIPEQNDDPEGLDPDASEPVVDLRSYDDDPSRNSYESVSSHVGSRAPSQTPSNSHRRGESRTSSKHSENRSTSRLSEGRSASKHGENRTSSRHHQDRSSSRLSNKRSPSITSSSSRRATSPTHSEAGSHTSSTSRRSGTHRHRKASREEGSTIRTIHESDEGSEAETVCTDATYKGSRKMVLHPSRVPK